MVVQLRFVARYLCPQTGDLLLQLLDVRRSEGRVKRRQNLALLEPHPPREH